jgi:hypothetical protein
MNERQVRSQAQFSSYQKGSAAGRPADYSLLSPAVGIEVIDTSSGDHPLSSTTGAKGLWVGTTGNVKVMMVDGSEAVFVGVTEGTLIPIQFQLVFKSGTTADSLVALI